MESKVHVALRVDGSVDSEDINIGQDRIELIHNFFAVSILGTSIMDELMLPGPGGLDITLCYPHTTTRVAS